MCAQAAAFHQKCDGKVRTITVVRSTQGAAGGNVFGGYAGGAAWHSSGSYVSAGDAFLFSLHNKHGKAIKLLCTNPGSAIYCHPSYGPSFGPGHDIYISNSMTAGGGSYCNPNGYTSCDARFFATSVDNTLLAGTYNGWAVAEIEVFTLE